MIPNFPNNFSEDGDLDSSLDPHTASSSDFRPDLRFDQQLDRALATPPTLSIPANFAALLAVQASAQPPSQAAAPVARYGRVATLLSGAALLLLVLVLAPHAAHGSAKIITLESVLAIEFALLTLAASSTSLGLRWPL